VFDGSFFPLFTILILQAFDIK